MHQRSTSPEEAWGDDGDDGEWPVDGVVGEDIDVTGTSSYEIRWSNWHRKDGTNTTWAREIPDNPALIHTWHQVLQDQRHAQAVESPRIALPPLSMAALHDRRTAEYSEAFREKAQRRIRLGPDRYSDFDGDVHNAISKHEDAAKQVEVLGEPRPVRAMPRRPRPVQQSPSMSPTISRTSSTRGTDVLPPSARAALQEKWNKAVRRAGAALLTIVSAPGIDDIPNLPGNFEYREKGYAYPPDVILPDEGMFLSCECKGHCSLASACSCQDISHLTDDFGDRTYAYTREGLLSDTFPIRGPLAVECNQNCSCDSDCPNRVAQKPRDVPLELYNTVSRGWGVRAPVKLQKGKVLGCYTGELIHRREAQGPGMAGVAKSYLFDLDGLEPSDEDEDLDSFTVNAFHQGNWTRFVNHSCEPNMRVYSVIFDTIPEMKAPALAFVTTKEIPPNTELTIDYNPRFGENARKAKKGGKVEIPGGAIQCLCGKESCRGWVVTAE